MRDLLLLERISRPEAENAWHVGVGSIAEWEDPIAVERLRELQDDYFRIALDEYSALQGGISFDAGGWINPGQEIGGSAAETVLSDFFSNR